MIIWRPTLGSNVISSVSSTTILEGLTSGSTRMFEVFINVYCVSSFEMMIQINGVFELQGGTLPWNPIDYMGMCWLGTIGACITWGSASETWIKSSNNGMFRFASPLSNPWTYQTIESNNNLENEISSSLRNSKGSCSTSSSSNSLMLWGPRLIIHFCLHFDQHWTSSF
jgi:hypothetical protein